MCGGVEDGLGYSGRLVSIVIFIEDDEEIIFFGWVCKKCIFKLKIFFLFFVFRNLIDLIFFM